MVWSAIRLILSYIPESGGKAEITLLHLSPDPVNLAADSVKLSINATISSVVSGKLEARLTLKKKVGFFWVKVPCINGVGSW